VTQVGSYPLVSVVLSFRNEEQTLPELVKRLQSVLRTLPVRYELIFVNDHSLDRSLDLLITEHKADPRVKVVSMSRRFGVYECMMAGIGYSTGDAVITMDADLQDPPEVIPALIEKWREGADVAYTVRRSRSGESAARLWVTRLAYRVIRCVSDIPLPVDAGDYKLMSRRVADRVLQMNEAHPYLRGLIAWVGFRQEPVYYDRQPRFARVAQPSTWWRGRAAKVLFAGISFSSVLPMTILLYFGCLGLVMGALAALTLVILSLAGVQFSGWLWLLAAVFLLSGLQMSGIGMVGLYINTVLHQVRGRPQYIVESTIGLTERP